MSYHAFFNPDDAGNIISATRSSVSLMAWYHHHDDDDEHNELLDEDFCILNISRDMYFNVMDEWLDEKSRYCANGKIDGQGAISFSDLRKLPEGATLPAHLVRRNADGSRYGADAYIAEFATTGRTEHYVDMEGSDDLEAPVPEAVNDVEMER